MKNKFLFVLFISLSLCSCGNNNAKKVDNRFTLSNLGNSVDFHTDLQADYLEDEDYENVPDICDGTKELSLPESIKLTWESSEELDSYVVGIGEKEDLSDQKEYVVQGKKELELYNLKIDTKYYWTVSEQGNELKSKVASFKTTSIGPRNLNIPGMTNCRDMGGYYTRDGKKVRQDLLLRTGNSDNITEAGRQVMKDFKIKTEIDLRDTGYKSASPIGNDVNYLVYKMFYDDYSNYLERNCESVKSVFKVFADEEAYPIIYHCRIGTDRTGFVAYLLLGLFGVEEEDIYRDYLFSNFGVIEKPRTLHGSGVDNVQLYYEAVNDFPGENLQEKVYNFLIGIGLSEDELDTIIDLNVEKANEVLKGNRPISIFADEFESSTGFNIQSYDNPNSKSTIYFYPLNQNVGKYITASFTLREDKEVDIYCYMYAGTSSLTIRACDALSLELDDDEIEVTTKTFSDLHCRNSAGIYVCARLANEDLIKGDYSLKITNIAKGTNTTGLGANIASVVIIPRD